MEKNFGIDKFYHFIYILKRAFKALNSNFITVTTLYNSTKKLKQ